MKTGWGLGLVVGLLVCATGCREAVEVPEPGKAEVVDGGGGAPSTKPAPSPRSGDEEPTKLPRTPGRKVVGTPPPVEPPGTEMDRGYRVALRIPGKPGFVFNPFTNNPVDVRGIPAGTLCMDPMDSDKTHRFRVPKMPDPEPAEGDPEAGDR